MALTKAERAHIRVLRERAALAWPTFERPTPLDIRAERARLEAKGAGNVVAAWWVTVTGSFGGVEVRTGLGWTDGNGHSRSPWVQGRQRWQQHGAQGPGGPWFATELEAMKEGRWQACERAAGSLADLDERIEAASLKEPA